MADYFVMPRQSKTRDTQLDLNYVVAFGSCHIQPPMFATCDYFESIPHFQAQLPILVFWWLRSCVTFLSRHKALPFSFNH